VILAQVGGQAPAPEPVLNQSSNPLLSPFKLRPIGPAVMAGRIDDIEGVEKDPTTIYVGYALGGLWKTTDGGVSWDELFETQPVSTIGDVAIAPSDPNILYVGSGEANNRQSSTSGNGMYKSTDAGKTWTHIGLVDTQSIARVVVNPANPDVVYVAAMGHLFGPNDERGVFKSVDGGKTWKKVLFVNNLTGASDIAINYTNPKIMFATMYQRVRTGWGYNGGVPNGGAGIYQSTDAGDTWKKVTAPGLPTNPILGRIAVAISRSNPKVVMAQIEVGASAGEGANVDDDGGPLKQGDLTLTAGQTNHSDTVPQAGRGGRGGGGGGNFGGGRGNQAPPDPNKSGIWRSEDGGLSWKFLTNNDTRPMYYTQLRIDPKNDQIVWTGGLNITRSLDGGKTFRTLNASHTDNHALWIDPTDGRHVLIGHDGGLEITYAGQADQVTWDKISNFNIGLFYAVSADMRHPYHVCGGLQDNGSWCGPSAMRTSGGRGAGGGPILNADWISVGGGDGFYTQNDPTDYNIFYTESQQGSMSRYNMRTGQQQSIQPRVGGGRGGANVLNAPHPQMYFRFYWDTPIVLSPFDPATVYTGAQYFFKSNNRGDTWTMNPNDLSKNVDRYKQSMMGVDGMAPTASKHDGYENNSNIVTIAASPVKRGVIWVGTDDGNLHVSMDEGEHFTNVIANVTGRPTAPPLDYVQIARIEASHFEPGGAYVTIDNHRNDDWKPYIFKTSDYGKTWTNVTGNLPSKGQVNVIREDLENPNLLFAGTEYGLYATLDGGKTWEPFQNGMPFVRVDDLLIHPRDRDLIVATHARSIWIMDDITPLEQLSAKTDDVVLFDPRPAIQWKNDISINRSEVPAKQWKGQNPQGGTAISIMAKSAVGAGKIEFLENNQVVGSMDVDIKAGLNRFQWNMMGTPPAAAPGQGGPGGGQAQFGQGGGRGRGGNNGVPFVAGGRGGFGGGNMLDPGTYQVRLTVGGKTYMTSVTIMEDIWMMTEK
jgi:photosystem II stability/assembly factor-like uncharacterized protein